MSRENFTADDVSSDDGIVLLVWENFWRWWSPDRRNINRKDGAERRKSPRTLPWIPLHVLQQRELNFEGRLTRATAKRVEYALTYDQFIDKVRHLTLKGIIYCWALPQTSGKQWLSNLTEWPTYTSTESMFHLLQLLYTQEYIPTDLWNEIIQRVTRVRALHLCPVEFGEPIHSSSLDTKIELDIYNFEKMKKHILDFLRGLNRNDE
jgi:hypothetical protein